MECMFCGKTLIISKKFIENNDIVECSNCKNSFRYSAEIVKPQKIEKTDTSIILLFLLIRLFIAILITFSYFYFLHRNIDNILILFFVLNYLFFILNVFANIIYFKKMPDYSLLFNDKYFNTRIFWINAAELILTALANLIFFIIY
ncbi:MAG TPA: hypothetical protein PLM75_07715 [bacterium]|nr:hypothetical protein [bacterium]HPP87726.1 hypothetical protein [bacterium]